MNEFSDFHTKSELHWENYNCTQFVLLIRDSRLSLHSWSLDESTQDNYPLACSHGYVTYRSWQMILIPTTAAGDIKMKLVGRGEKWCEMISAWAWRHTRGHLFSDDEQSLWWRHGYEIPDFRPMRRLLSTGTVLQTFSTMSSHFHDIAFYYKNKANRLAS